MHENIEPPKSSLSRSQALYILFVLLSSTLMVIFFGPSILEGLQILAKLSLSAFTPHGGLTLAEAIRNLPF